MSSAKKMRLEGEHQDQDQDLVATSSKHGSDSVIVYKCKKCTEFEACEKCKKTKALVPLSPLPDDWEACFLSSMKRDWKLGLHHILSGENFKMLSWMIYKRHVEPSFIMAPINPAVKDIFNWTVVPFDQVKAIAFGKEPINVSDPKYRIYKPFTGNGLAYSVITNKTTKGALPPTLSNIRDAFKQAFSDSLPVDEDFWDERDLTEFSAKTGILLLNYRLIFTSFYDRCRKNDDKWWELVTIRWLLFMTDLIKCVKRKALEEKRIVLLLPLYRFTSSCYTDWYMVQLIKETVDDPNYMPLDTWKPHPSVWVHNYSRCDMNVAITYLKGIMNKLANNDQLICKTDSTN